MIYLYGRYYQQACSTGATVTGGQVVYTFTTTLSFPGASGASDLNYLVRSPAANRHVLIATSCPTTSACRPHAVLPCLVCVASSLQYLSLQPEIVWRQIVGNVNPGCGFTATVRGCSHLPGSASDGEAPSRCLTCTRAVHAARARAQYQDSTGQLYNIATSATATTPAPRFVFADWACSGR